jgi:hypothetical protein
MPRSSATREPAAASVGTLNEGPLHASLKAHYAQPGDQLEAVVDGYIVDILRGDRIIEVQTANFAQIARKMRRLVANHRVRLVYPVPRDLWIVKLPQADGGVMTRRKSPKRRDVFDVFRQLVSFPELIAHENFQLDVVLTEEEAVWRHEPGKRWRRRGWVTVERRLLSVYETLTLQTTDDYCCLIPNGVPGEFLTSDLATALRCPRRLAQQVAYCLRKAGVIESVGSHRNAVVYTRTPALTMPEPP